MPYPAGHDPNNAADTPDFDDWGSDDWWVWQDWALWHSKMVAAYGKPAADKRWLTAWHKQGDFSGPVNDRGSNPNFRKWAKGEGILEQLYGWEYVLGQPVALVTDTTSVAVAIAGEALAAAEDAAASASWLVRHPWLALGGVAVVGLTALVVVLKVQGAAANAAGRLAR